MKNVYSIADTAIEIETEYDYLHDRCRGYISSELPEFSIKVTEENISHMKNQILSYQKLTGADTQSQNEAYLEYIAAYELIAERLLEKDILLFHGSVLSFDGKGYMFTAPSGTGKSTHSGLWREAFKERVIMINDDKPLLQFRDDGIYAYGTPWCGKHSLGSNMSVRLNAIAILERADNNHIEQIRLIDAVPEFFAQSYRPDTKLGMKKSLDLIGRMNNSVSFYRLFCNMDIEAAMVAEKAMNRV